MVTVFKIVSRCEIRTMPVIKLHTFSDYMLYTLLALNGLMHSANPSNVFKIHTVTFLQTKRIFLLVAIQHIVQSIANNSYCQSSLLWTALEVI
jgi:hypothetical protein